MLIPKGYLILCEKIGISILTTRRYDRSKEGIEINQEQLETLVEQYQLLLHKVLGECGRHAKQDDYEDYFQELSIKLLELAERFDGDPLGDEDDRYRFTSYARQGLKRHLIDMLRKEKFWNDAMTAPLSEYIFESEVGELSIENLLVLMNDLRRYLTSGELNLVKGLVNGINSKELAKCFGVSRKTIAKWKGQIRQKLSEIW